MRLEGWEKRLAYVQVRKARFHVIHFGLTLTQLLCWRGLNHYCVIWLIRRTV
jgi:hypothetical protein